MSVFSTFDIAGSALSAQSLRLNLTASNLANMHDVAGNAADVYRSREAMFRAAGDPFSSALAGVDVLGVVESTAPPIERYDPGRDIKFETYAISRIKGAIIDELRSMDWVPRSVRSRAREIERTIAELENKNHRPPTDEEIAGAIGITEEEFQDNLTQIARSSVAALDELWTIGSSGGDTVSLIDTLQDPNADDPSLEMTRTEVRESLATAISKLPERERTVITLYYYEELTLREIGEVLGVTESRVSQLHTKAILRLKAKLQGSLERASLERNR